MTPQEVINQLRDLIKDRKSLMTGDYEHDEILCADIEALNIAVEALEKANARKVIAHTVHEDAKIGARIIHKGTVDWAIDWGDKVMECD